MRGWALTLSVLALTACDSGHVGPSSATLVLAIHTVGGEQDPDGYLLQVEGVGDTAVGVEQVVTLEVPPGLYFLADQTSDEVVGAALSIDLQGIAANCQSAHSTSTVKVGAGAVDSAGYTITCIAAP